tara:strand:- start:317 stop:685 length:369 start_codon:yes stop_codon:yes gene_type:complete
MKNLGIVSEHDECVALVQYFAYKPTIGPFLIHIPNEGKRSARAGKKLKDAGLRPGIPDYFLAVPTKKYSGMWVEMKRKNGRYKLTGEQANWITKLLEQGYYATFAFGAEDAISKILRYIDDE